MARRSTASGARVRFETANLSQIPYSKTEHLSRQARDDVDQEKKRKARQGKELKGKEKKRKERKGTTGCSFVCMLHACAQGCFLSHLYIKVIFLPRQARDKHRENSKKARAQG